MESILDLLSSVAVTFLLSESAAERGSVPGDDRERGGSSDEGSYSIRLLKPSEEGSRELAPVES